jgi:hypothetical protein
VFANLFEVMKFFAGKLRFLRIAGLFGRGDRQIHHFSSCTGKFIARVLPLFPFGKCILFDSLFSMLRTWLKAL